MKKIEQLMQTAIESLEQMKAELKGQPIVGEYYYFTNFEPFNVRHHVFYGKLEKVDGNQYCMNGLWFDVCRKEPIVKGL